MRRRHEFAGHISRAETAGHPYLYVPFEVPPRCTRIEVAYHYAPAQPTAEDATLDIGIFDIRGTEHHPHHVGDPTTLVWCAGGLSEAAVLEGIGEGRTAISDGPDGPLVWLEQSADGIVTAHFRGAEGTTLEFIADGERQLRLETPADAGSLAVPASVRFDRYLRAELRTEAPKGREDVRGLSAPVYRD
ncbi:MAG TPA: hypothetical protein PJ994_04335 [Tepidiformaceae bacterium]|nr:hypothetical protein [Tepidiformaceae bacterium]